DSPLGRSQLDSLGESSVVAARFPIGNGRLTQTQDGKAVAPLMGQQSRYDGGVSSFVVLPFVYIQALNDFIRMIQFLPTSAEHTDVVITWLVEGSSTDEQVDTDRMTWLWDVTTRQDKEIVERNAVGVRSAVYQPGPYSMLEQWTANF